MTKDEIKKAFDICCDAQTQSCTGCPILELEKRNEHGCKFNLFTSVIDIVTEQEKEIERLKDKCEELRNEKWDAQDDLDCYCDEMPDKIKQAKIDILNNVKTYSYCDNNFMDGKWHRYVFVSDIDELIKEVQNGEDKG